MHGEVDGFVCRLKNFVEKVNVPSLRGACAGASVGYAVRPFFGVPFRRGWLWAGGGSDVLSMIGRRGDCWPANSRIAVYIFLRSATDS